MILRQPRSRTKAPYEQAQANYGIATSSSLPEEWQKAEFDLKTAKKHTTPSRKSMTAGKMLYKQGAMPRKELDQSAVALTQAKAQL